MLIDLSELRSIINNLPDHCQYAQILIAPGEEKIVLNIQSNRYKNINIKTEFSYYLEERNEL